MWLAVWSLVIVPTNEIQKIVRVFLCAGECIQIAAVKHAVAAGNTVPRLIVTDRTAYGTERLDRSYHTLLTIDSHFGKPA